MATFYNVAFPYDIDARARTAAAEDDTHIRDLVAQVLFTAPGERVNRPDFGCGLLRLVFEPNSDALAATLQFTVQGALQQWLGDRIEIETVQVEHQESILRVTVAYRIRRTGRREVATFEEER
jgi:phage baseplate assembly protein W